MSTKNKQSNKLSIKFIVQDDRKIASSFPKMADGRISVAEAQCIGFVGFVRRRKKPSLNHK